MSPDKLVYMANQIGKFFAHQSDEKAVAAIAEHIEAFWERRMKTEIFTHLAAGGAGLEDRPKRALGRLQANR